MTKRYDVVVIGAGFAGLYAMHKFRDQLGLSTHGFDAAGGPGGTWWWNRYPGARCDIESVHYSYSFSDEIQRGWQWSERYASQAEILEYLEYVANALDVLKDYTFDVRVESTVWDEDAQRWTVTTDDGETFTARFVVAATGNLSFPKGPEFPGAEDFEGEIYLTSRWPHEGVDLSGKRVGVIGTGSTGIQVIQEVAEVAGHLTVFQRTATFAAPLGNGPVSKEERRWLAENHAEVRAGSRESIMGVPLEAPHPSSHAVTPDERRARYDELWDKGGFSLLVASYADVLVDQAANDMLADYIRERIRERVTDPSTADLLCPTDYPYGTKRATFEAGYYEVFNRDNVRLVDVRSDPIDKATKNGLRTANIEHPLDVLILATGFDAITGPLLNLGLVGRGGVTLAERWADGPETYLGIAVDGFPNLFTITGPTSAVGLYNNPLAIEDHVDLAAAAVKHTFASHEQTIEATKEASDRWGAIVDGLLHMTLFPKAKSWYMGDNVPGKKRSTFIFVGSAALYRAFTAEVQASGFSGFAVGGKSQHISSMLKLDPSALGLLNALMTSGAKPLHESSLEEIRAGIEGFAQLQGPARDVRVTETTYPGPGGELPARVYVPAAAGPLPVIVCYHGGGFIAGSLDAFDKPCRALADDLQAIVVAPSYRLAPEHPFPAAVDDAFAALRWAADVAAEHGGDPLRIAVAGESAGGNLAAVAAQRARDVGGPELIAQILITPVTDLIPTQSGSWTEFANAPILTAAAAELMIATYLGAAGNSTSPLASPARADSLSDLPPTLVVTMECDPLRDQGEAYARALAEAGVLVTVKRIDGLPHGTFSLAGVLPRSSEITTAVDEFFARIVNQVPTLNR